jgi:hypothetical protein
MRSSSGSILKPQHSQVISMPQVPAATKAAFVGMHLRVMHADFTRYRLMLAYESYLSTA